ncbi:hypothetical protein LTR56_008126 [Elasticomyces elasticus]|nr:hypothetical protein LTR56_008126 [Elasticomyces elasticus]KAK4930073.1 hypothetical protein LTR49_003401 [Elasticomyces elasticus]KAK5763545.1 hypothetical protein LTS12_006316 [Elasticomyces elasticus]
MQILGEVLARRNATRNNTTSADIPADMGPTQHSEQVEDKEIYLSMPSKESLPLLTPSPTVSPPLARTRAVPSDREINEKNSCIAQFKYLVEGLGRPSGPLKGFLNYDRATTANAMRGMKKLFAQTNLPADVQAIHDHTKVLAAKTRWRFGDIFEAIDFLSAYGRDDVFNKARMTAIIFIDPPFPEGGESCELPNRETEIRCECAAEGCLICAFNDGDDNACGQRLCKIAYNTTIAEPCPHLQHSRFFTFLAANLTRFVDPSSRTDIERLRIQVITCWRKHQVELGWKFPNGDFPPNDMDRSVELKCDNGATLKYMLYMTKHGEEKTKADVLTYVWIGPFELML